MEVPGWHGADPNTIRTVYSYCAMDLHEIGTGLVPDNAVPSFDMDDAPLC